MPLRDATVSKVNAGFQGTEWTMWIWICDDATENTALWGRHKLWDENNAELVSMMTTVNKANKSEVEGIKTTVSADDKEDISHAVETTQN